MNGEHPEVCIRPNLEDWNALVVQHQEFVQREFERTSSAFAETFPERTGMSAGVPPPEPIPEMRKTLDFSKTIPWQGAVADPIREDDLMRSMVPRLLPEPWCPTSFLWPPFPWVSPSTPAIVRPGPTGYARSVACAHTSGRIEIGAAAVPQESVALLGDLRISTAAASVTAAKAITPVMKPSKVTVYADVVVNALFALIGMGPKALAAGINVDLVLTVTTFKGGIQSVSERKTLYQQQGIPLFVYLDKMTAQTFSLTVSTDLSGSDYLIASLTVEATAIAEKEQSESGAGAIVDMEGFKNPPGEVPYLNGSVFVPGFMIKVCEQS